VVRRPPQYDNDEAPAHLLVEHTVFSCALSVGELGEGFAYAMVPNNVGFLRPYSTLNSLHTLSALPGLVNLVVAHVDDFGELRI